MYIYKTTFQLYCFNNNQHHDHNNNAHTHKFRINNIIIINN